MEKMNDLKEELIQILTPIFGQGTKNILENYYTEGEDADLIALARHMLSGYMGKEAAEHVLDKIISRHKIRMPAEPSKVVA